MPSWHGSKVAPRESRASGGLLQPRISLRGSKSSQHFSHYSSLCPSFHENDFPALEQVVNVDLEEFYRKSIAVDGKELEKLENSFVENHDEYFENEEGRRLFLTMLIKEFVDRSKESDTKHENVFKTTQVILISFLELADEITDVLSIVYYCSSPNTLWVGLLIAGIIFLPRI